MLFYSLGLYFSIWLLYLLAKKLGWFDWFRTTEVYQTKAYKRLSFVSKIYIYPTIIDVKKDKTDVVKLGKTYRWISFINFVAFCGFLGWGVLSMPDDYFELSLLQQEEFHLATGEVHQVIKVKPRTSYRLKLKNSEGVIQSFRYVERIMNESVMKELKGKQATISYFVTLYGDKKLVTIMVEGKKYGSVKEYIIMKKKQLTMALEWWLTAFLIALVLPWIRYKKYGLIKFIR